MKGTREILKRLCAGLIAGVMLTTAIGPQTFAEGENEQSGEKTVVSWSWQTDNLMWDAEQEVWKLDFTLSEGETLSQEMLEELLPDTVTATLAASGEGAVPASTDNTVQQSAAEEESNALESEESSSVSNELGDPVEPAEIKSETEPEESVQLPGEEGVPEQEETDEVSGEKTEERPAAHEKSAPKEQTVTLGLTWVYGALNFPLETGSYVITAQLPQGYTLDEAAPALEVQIHAGPEAIAPLADNDTARDINDIVTDAVSPIGTTINLFDYWLTTQDGRDDNSDHNAHVR